MQITKRKFGATRGKLALVAVLAIVQGGVLVRALRHASTPGQEQTNVKFATNQPAPAATANVPPALQASADNGRPWPQLSLNDALACDPFQRPQWLMAALPASTDAEAASSKKLEQLKQQGASIVIVSGDGKAATIGSRQFRVGDVIDGYQVTDITTRGVEFTEIPAR